MCFRRKKSGILEPESRCLRKKPCILQPGNRFLHEQPSVRAPEPFRRNVTCIQVRVAPRGSGKLGKNPIWVPRAPPTFGENRSCNDVRTSWYNLKNRETAFDQHTNGKQENDVNIVFGQTLLRRGIHKSASDPLQGVENITPMMFTVLRTDLNTRPIVPGSKNSSISLGIPNAGNGMCNRLATAQATTRAPTCSTDRVNTLFKYLFPIGMPATWYLPMSSAKSLAGLPLAAFAKDCLIIIFNVF